MVEETSELDKALDDFIEPHLGPAPFRLSPHSTLVKDFKRNAKDGAIVGLKLLLARAKDRSYTDDGNVDKWQEGRESDLYAIKLSVLENLIAELVK